VQLSCCALLPPNERPFMRFLRLSILTLALAAAFILAIDAADARVGGGKSQGSRGGQTLNPPPPTPTTPKTVAPIGRSMTEPGAPSKVQAANRPETSVTPSRFGGFGGLLMGGLLGAGLFGLISGSGLLGGLTGLASFFGLLLQIALIGGAVWLVVKYRRHHNQPAPAHAPANLLSSTSPRDLLNRFRQTLASNGGSAASVTPARAIGPGDYDAFERLLREIQTAYGHENTDALGATTTPEMFSYFSQDLAENAKKGVRNEVSGAKLLQGDLAEAWHEAGSDYATVAMRYSLVDSMVDRATGSVISGDPITPQEVTEIWTFRRDDRDPEQGWQLSAIQQVEIGEPAGSGCSPGR
jgi:predicted lipid-binding transport protein (Tim44 family)